ncbi:hypothetical protein DYB32_004593 [Aphanomyces invadans]|uniref:TOG domain-containing protein n=1 Tax=Aphanomyces invadans TaxID=157072 RepID=A0A3R7A9K6_9STRA|nr:hypothetical protein DYB32_004593 [Aphanomyces invadans]
MPVPSPFRRRIRLDAVLSSQIPDVLSSVNRQFYIIHGERWRKLMRPPYYDAASNLESKIRLSGVGAADPFVDDEGWEDLTSALVGCLTDNNSKVSQGSLKVLAKVVASPRKSPDAIRPWFGQVWGSLKEKMGDSKLPVREAATDLLLVFMEKLGMSSVMDRLKLCAAHKNWRTREQDCLRFVDHILNRGAVVGPEQFDALNQAADVPAGVVSIDSVTIPSAGNKAVQSRVALQHLQRIVANGGAQLAVFVTSLRPLREPICEQVSDLRSTVSREACATITTLATCMGDDTFHPFVEYFVAALLKATFVTIQVISTSADACLKSIVLSGRGSGYPKALPKYIDLLAALLPVIILDAQADVRAAARKCFWAFHSQYEVTTVLIDLGALRVQNSDAAAATTTVATAVTGAARVLNRKSLPAKDPDDPSAPVRLTVQGPLRVLNPSPAPPENVATAAVSIGAKRVETGAPAAKQSSVVTLPASSRYELHSGHSDSAPPPPSQPPTSSQTHGSSNKQLRSVDENNMDDAKDDIAVAGLFEKADDSLWLTRLEALERLAKLVEMRNPANAPIVTSAKLPKLLQKRVGDSHYRVVQAALKLTLVVLTSSTAGRTSSTTTTTTLLPWKTILPKVFLKAVDSKDSVRAAAIAVLEAFAANVEPSALAMAVVSTMLDGIPVKVKAVVFQFVAPLVPSAIDLFSNATFLRSVVLKIVLFVEQDASSSAATTAAVGSLINALYNCVVVLFQHAPDDLVDVYLPQTIPALLDVALECGGSIEFNVVQARVMQTIQTLVTHHAQTIARHLEPIAVLVLERCSASLTPSSLMAQYFVDKTLQLCLSTVDALARLHLLVPFVVASSTSPSSSALDLQVVLKCLRLAMELLDMHTEGMSRPTFDNTAKAVVAVRCVQHSMACSFSWL